MTTKTMQNRPNRFPVDREIFVAFVGRDEPVIVGTVTEVTGSGIAVRYLAPDELGGEKAAIRIFGPDLPPTGQIECRVVSDVVAADGNFINMSVRSCELEFGQVPDGV